MGTVYRAQDTRLGRPVALKFLNDALAQDPQAVERFLREARAASTLNHPSICVVHDVGDFEGRPFIAMELLEGRTLKRWIHEGPRRFDALLELAIEIGDGLSAAHAKGIVHRDVKPTNVFVTTEGQAKVLDFGLAKLARPLDPDSVSSWPTASEDREIRTSPGAVLGTVGYMSPEQARGWELDARTDIFSFGAVLYEMATGRAPFDGDTAALIFDAILNRDPTPPSRLEPTLPEAMDRIVLRALDKDREVRYQTARDLVADLKRMRRDSSSPRHHRPPLLPEASRRHSRLLARRGPILSALAALSLAALGLFWARQPRRLEVTGYHQLTTDREFKSWPLTDGSRVYLTESTGPDAAVVVQVAAQGGDTSKIPMPFSNALVTDISRSGTELLVAGQQAPVGSAGDPVELWAVPLVGGAPRRLGDLRANTAVWSPDDRRIAYAAGRRLFVAEADGSGAQPIWSAPGFVDVTDWSPDGRRLSLCVEDPRTRTTALWSIAPDGSDPRPVLPGFDRPAAQGRWTADGRYLIFEANDGGAPLRPLGPSDEGRLALTHAKAPPSHRGPVQLLPRGAGPRGQARVRPRRPPPGRAGSLRRQVRAVGPRAGRSLRPVPRLLARRPPSGLRQLPGRRSLAERNPRRPAGSTDIPAAGGRISAVVAGRFADRLHRGPAPGGVVHPPRLGRGRRAAGRSRRRSEPGGCHLVSRRCEPGRGIQPHRASRGSPHHDPARRRPHRRSHSIPGSEGLFSPRWSPDGRTLAALTRDSFELRLYDFATGKWRTLMKETRQISYPAWSQDGRALFVNEGSARLKVAAADGRREVAADLTDLRQAVSPFGFGSWFGETRDDSILALRDVSVRELFALDLETR